VPKQAFLIRAASGTLHTIHALTIHGALDLFMLKFRPAHGDTVEIKPRGHGEWSAYTIHA
jgi:hypothetical protein